MRVSVAHIDIRGLHFWYLHIVAAWVGISSEHFRLVQVASLDTLGRIREAKGLRREGALRGIATHSAKLLVAFLTLVFNLYIGIVGDAHAHLVYLLADKKLVVVFRRYGHLVALEVANKVSKGLCACINAERERLFQPFVFLDDGRSRCKWHSVGDDLHRCVLIAHGTDVAADIIHVFEEMSVAFDGQLYGIGEHLIVVEERILQLDTDGCVFL